MSKVNISYTIGIKSQDQTRMFLLVLKLVLILDTFGDIRISSFKLRYRVSYCCQIGGQGPRYFCWPLKQHSEKSIHNLGEISVLYLGKVLSCYCKICHTFHSNTNLLFFVNFILSQFMHVFTKVANNKSCPRKIFDNSKLCSVSI